MIQCLWDHQVKTIIYVKIGDADVDTYKYEPMTVLLARWKNIKKDKHGKHCHEQRKHFLPFVLSVYGMLGREALAVISQLSQVPEKKREEHFSQLLGWVNRRIVISLERSYSRMIHKAQLPNPLREGEPGLDTESGIGLAG